MNSSSLRESLRPRKFFGKSDRFWAAVNSRSCFVLSWDTMLSLCYVMMID